MRVSIVLASCIACSTLHAQGNTRDLLVADWDKLNAQYWQTDGAKLKAQRDAIGGELVTGDLEYLTRDKVFFQSMSQPYFQDRQQFKIPAKLLNWLPLLRRK